MTNLLYQLDSMIREFEATVTDVNAETRGVLLDRTAFYPGGGGQPCDEGELTFGGQKVRVTRVEKGNWHIIAEGDPLPDSGTRVSGTLNWERRYQLMRTHTAMHILCGVV
ncbi:MAG: Ala-tRNA(Pro) hydrolase, partial [Phototrophicales bacterium]